MIHKPSPTPLPPTFLLGTPPTGPEGKGTEGGELFSSFHVYV